MSRAMTWFGLLMMTGSLAVADDVWVGQLPYNNVTIVEVTATSMTFDLRGRRLTKALDEVTKIHVRANSPFNQAEDLLAQGRFDEALAEYRLAASKATEGWEKVLVGKRQEMAERRKAAPAPPQTTPTTAKAPTAVQDRCYYCRSAGLMPCTHCMLGERTTGRGRCPDCGGIGRVPCPSCEGNSFKRKCSGCGGDGKAVVGTTRDGVFIRDIEDECSRCSGSGYADFCSGCRGQSLSNRGSLPCEKCGNTGFYGDCASCRGTKKIACTHCEAGKQHAPPGESEPEPKVETGPLATPEALLDSMPKRPDASSMTAIQFRQAQLKYQEECRKWASEQTGKKAVWRGKVTDVKPLKSRSTITLSATSPEGTEFSVVFPADKSDELAKLSKDQMVVVTAEIAADRYSSSGFIEVNGDRSVEVAGLCLKGIDVVPAAETGSRTELFGIAHAADRIVYLLDSGGSMLGHFDQLRTEVIRSIEALSEKQTFHVVFLGAAGPKENGPAKLVPATADNKAQAIAFIKNHVPSGKTSAVDALQRASAVLADPPNERSKGVIYFVTDGGFADSEKLPAAVKASDAPSLIAIHAVLFGQAGADAAKMLERIVGERSGEFRHVAPKSGAWLPR